MPAVPVLLVLSTNRGFSTTYHIITVCHYIHGGTWYTFKTPYIHTRYLLIQQLAGLRQTLRVYRAPIPRAEYDPQQFTAVRHACEKPEVRDSLTSEYATPKVLGTPQTLINKAVERNAESAVVWYLQQ